MDVFEGHRALAAPPRAACVAIGNFDGVHQGHRALLAEARARADALGGTAVVLTFDPHPTAVLAPHLAPLPLTSLARKLELIAAAGIDAAVVEPFTAELAALPAGDFVEQVLIGALGVRHVVVGWDFTYGKGRGGTTSTLEAHGARAGFAVTVLDKVLVDGELASSTRIRGHLRAGELASARRLLGRDYDVDGTVVRGEGRGRGLGIPTANVAPDAPIALSPGIYAAWVDHGGARHRAAVSLGTNPTFTDAGRLVLEAHLLDFEGDLYDQHVRVTFVARLRDEERYETVEALLAQIDRDVAETRRVLSAAT